jgi:hypothetical protein
MGKMVAFWNLFRVGGVVADAAKWKRRQITVTLLAPVIAAIVQALRAFGVIDLPISDADCDKLAGAVIVLANVVLTLTTSDKVGVGSVPRADDGGAVASASPAVPVAERNDGA